MHFFFFFLSWLPVSKKWREKKLSYFSYCCSQIILVLVLQLICKTVFFSYLHYSLALLVADLALSERTIASGDGWQSGSKGPPHLLQGFLMLETVKFQVDVATEPLVLTDVDILYCIELSCSWVVFPFECCLLIMHFKKKKKKASPSQITNFNDCENDHNYAHKWPKNSCVCCCIW